jgi:hypothetical protein
LGIKWAGSNADPKSPSSDELKNVFTAYIIMARELSMEIIVPLP